MTDPSHNQTDIARLLEQLDLTLTQVGVVVVDHGSRRGESNVLLEDVVRLFAENTPYRVVEPAHMELAEPSIETAFGQCIERGARLVVVHPYFLLPGRHWAEDIPRLAREASDRWNVPHLVTAPLGLHRLMAEIMSARIEHCLAHAVGEAEACAVCQDPDRCQVRPSRQ